MDTAHTIKLLTALSNGTDPFTGEAFPADSPYQHPEIIRALFRAIRQFEATGASTPRNASARSHTNAATNAAPTTKAGRPPNAGKPWSKDEDEALLGAYDTGATIEKLAQTHERSRLGVEARLAKFGRVPMPERVRSRQERNEPTEDMPEAMQVRQPQGVTYQIGV